jgi:hypothetical protein
VKQQSNFKQIQDLERMINSKMHLVQELDQALEKNRSKQVLVPASYFNQQSQNPLLDPSHRTLHDTQNFDQFTHRVADSGKRDKKSSRHDFEEQL